MDAIIDENKKSWLQRFILWREKKIREKHFILILSFLAGIFTALAAWFLKFLVEWIKEFLTENFDSTGVNWLYLVYPVFGIFLTGLFIRYIVKDDISRWGDENIICHIPSSKPHQADIIHGRL